MVLDPVEQQRFRGLVPERAGSDAGYQISSRSPSPVLPRSSASTRTRGLTLGLGKARAGCPKPAISVSAGFKPIQRNGSAVRPRSRCSGVASIESSRPGRIEVVATSTSGGLLVLHDTYYPGWLAEVHGRPASILRAFALFRGVEVPAGTHRVTFRFAPFSFTNLRECCECRSCAVGQ
jgi:hypothetical protein